MKKLAALVGATLVATLLVPGGIGMPQRAAAQEASLMWVNNLAPLPGDPSVFTDFNAVSAYGTLNGLMIGSTTTGENAEDGGNKVVAMGLQVPPGFTIAGVRVCYEVLGTASFISQIRLAQLQDPPSTAVVMLDDGTDLIDPGPVCVDSAEPFAGPVDPTLGAVQLSLRVNFGNTNDVIVLRGVGLWLVNVAQASLQEQIDLLGQQLGQLREEMASHTHTYLTGPGVGHNKVTATSGPAMLPEEPAVDPDPLPKRKGRR